MREIKFRAWDTEEKEMLFNVQNTYDFGCRNDNKVMEESFGEVLSKGKYIVEQFTGLLDKNGNEIYEGDYIILFGETPTDLEQTDIKGQEVFYEAGTFQCAWSDGSDTFGGDTMLCLLNANEIEIIGNIHEAAK